MTCFCMVHLLLLSTTDQPLSPALRLLPNLRRDLTSSLQVGGRGLGPVATTSARSIEVSERTH